MQNQENIDVLSESALKLADTIGKLYYSIIEIELLSGQAWIFKNEPHLDDAGKASSWERLLEENLHWFYLEDHAYLLQELSLEKLEQIVEEPETERHFELRIRLENGVTRWIEIEITVISREERRLLITSKNIEEYRLLQKIVKLFVYKNCDYFIFLDVRNNRYEMLWRQKEQYSTPPVQSDDYINDFCNYIDTYVVPEDRKRLQQEIMPEYILSVLEGSQEHTSLYGFNDPKRGYTHKRLQYLFYDKRAQIVLLTRTDVTELYLDAKKQREVLNQALYRAQTDPLTEVYNHHTITSLIQEALAAGGETDGALMFIDLDDFKEINDIQGHPKGDEVLRFVAHTLRRALRSSDLIGRVGGDEFIAFLRGASAKEEIVVCAKRLCDAVKQYPNHDIILSCSIGIALSPADGNDYETLVRKADTAMYYAKKIGKNGYAFWDWVKGESIENARERG